MILEHKIGTTERKCLIGLRPKRKPGASLWHYFAIMLNKELRDIRLRTEWKSLARLSSSAFALTMFPPRQSSETDGKPSGSLEQPGTATSETAAFDPILASAGSMVIETKSRALSDKKAPLLRKSEAARAMGLGTPHSVLCAAYDVRCQHE